MSWSKTDEDEARWDAECRRYERGLGPRPHDYEPVDDGEAAKRESSSTRTEPGKGDV